MKTLYIPIDTTIYDTVECPKLVKRGDILRLQIKVFTDGVLRNLTGQNIDIILQKADGTLIENTIDIANISNGVVTAILDVQATVVAGLVSGELQLSNESGQESTNTFTFEVNSSLADGVLEVSKEDINTLNQLRDLIATGETTIAEYETHILAIANSIEAVEALENIKSYIDINLANLQQENAEAVVNIANETTQNSQAVQNIADLTEKNSTATSNISALDSKNSTASSNISSLDSKNSTATSNISALDAKNSAASTNVANLDSKNATATSNISNLDLKNDRAETNIATLGSFGDATTLLEDTTAVKQEIENARDGELNLGARLDNFDSSLSENMQQISATRQPYFDLRKKENTNNFYGLNLIAKLGDSISFGLNTVDRLNDAWLGIMRKMLQAELGTTNFGVEGINVSSSFTNIHDITKTGTWTWRNSGLNIGLQVMESVDSTATLTFTAKNTQKYFRILYDVQTNGGSFDVYINDVLQGTINTAGASVIDKYSAIYTVPTTNNTTFTIKIVKKDTNPITIGGVWYADDFAKYNFMPIVKSGQKLIDIDYTLLDKACSASILFMCLGHNDRGTDDTNLATFTQKINTIISKCNQYNTFVIVPDFIWTTTSNDFKFKSELKRLATETNGVYINFSDYLGHGDNTKLLALDFLAGSDYSHPTVHGHKIIAEAIAKNIGLSITSKEVANNYLSLIKPISTWNKILDTDLTAPFTNSYTTEQYISKYIKIGKTVYVFLQVNTNGATASAPICTLPSGYRPMTGLTFISNVVVATKEVNQIAVSEGGVITWTPTTTIFGNIKINFSFNVL
jgi:hypothetical protein